MFDILIATRNRDKIREITAVLSIPEVNFLDLDAVPDYHEPEENGKTFEDNAMIKASQAAYHSGFWSLADDSGLIIDALGGKPGIFSARFAGQNASYRDNWLKVLDLMKNIPIEKRTARFACVMCLVGNNNRAFFTRGEIEGEIITEPKGDNGFGYDPIFLPVGYNKTFAEMAPEEKNRISHRALALIKMKTLIESLSTTYKT